MKKTTLLFIAISVIGVTALSSCKKTTNCFDEALYLASRDNFCTMDCPGVVGCDGKQYCNACIAATRGIRVGKSR